MNEDQIVTEDNQPFESGEDKIPKSSGKKPKFEKVERNLPSEGGELTSHEGDIVTIFAEDKSKFIGEFLADDYKVIRGYTHGIGKQLRLYYTKLEPLHQKVASICIVHGFGEYSGRFLDIAEYFVKSNFVVHLIDLRGFGYSGAPRGCSTVEEMHSDIEVLLRHASVELPCFLYGHSMGGGLILSLALNNPDINLAGIIATSALIDLPKDRNITPFKRFMIKSIGKELEDVVANALINPTALTKNNYHIKKVFGDRLMIPFLGLNMTKSLVEMVDYLLPNAKKFAHPIFLLHGAQDIVTSVNDSIQFYTDCSSKVKDIKIFDKGYHELQHDEECGELKKLTLEWCLKRIPHSKPLGVLTKLRCGIPQKKANIKKLLLIILTIFFYIKFARRFPDQSLVKKLFWPFYIVKKFFPS